MTKKTISLAHLVTDKEVTLVSIEGGHGLRRRLTEMGLKEGKKFRVLHSSKPGPCIIRVGDTRLVLGHGMAHKVMVSED